MSNNRSILFINRVYPPQRGATGRILEDMAQGFAKDGWTVTVLTAGPAAHTEKRRGVSIITVKAPLYKKSAIAYGLVWLKLLFKALRVARHGLVITQTDPPMLILIGQIYARLKGAAHIHWCQDIYPDLLRPFSIDIPGWLYRFLHRKTICAMKQAERVVVIGRCMASYLERNGLPAAHMSFIPNWPDKILLEQASEGIDNDKFRVIYAGTIGRGHPLKAILEAVTILNETNPEIEFIFAGDDAGHQHMAAERDRRGLGNIKLIPFQPADKLPALMASGDIHLISQARDSLGMMVPSKFYSALAAARPCLYIGPEKSEIGRTIDAFSCGQIVENGDGKGLAKAILSYRENGDLWLRSHQGALKARDVFTPDASIAAFIKRARNLLANG